MSALLLTAVVSTRGKTSVALTANHLLAVVLLGQGSKSRLNDSSSHLEQHFNGSIRAHSISSNHFRVVHLLSSEDHTLVVIVNILLILDHLLDFLHSFCGLDLKRDSVSLDQVREGSKFTEMFQTHLQ